MLNAGDEAMRAEHEAAAAIRPRAAGRRAGLTTRPAFTLAEVIVTMAIIAMLAAVIVPTIRGRMQDAYENAIIAEFSNIETAVAAYRQDVGRYPPDIGYLYDLPSSATDRCGNNLTAADTLKWHGPYISRIISSSSYLFASHDTVYTTLYGSVGPTVSQMEIRMFGPDSLTAVNLDAKIDGAANATGGKLQYQKNTGGTFKVDYTIKYEVLVKANSC